MKKLLLLAAVTLAGCQTVSTTSLDPQLCLDHAGDPGMVVDNEPFRVTDEGGVGAFSFTGEVVSEEGTNPYTSEAVNFVYLVVSDDGSSAFDYFYDLAEKLKIDKQVDGQLYLKLGLLENGALQSNAYIKDAPAVGETVTLNMLIGTRSAMGATVDTVNPCLIRVE